MFILKEGWCMENAQQSLGIYGVFQEKEIILVLFDPNVNEIIE